MGALEGKTIIVTGASSGFGEAIAIACAAEGGNVSLVARRREALESVAEAARNAGGQALVCPADVSDDKQIQAALDTTRSAFGPIDILVNNAGINVTERSIGDTTAEQWRELMDVNLTSAFIFTKAVLPEMITRGDGLIVNLASRAGMYPSLKAGVGYQRVQDRHGGAERRHQRRRQSARRARLPLQSGRRQHAHHRPAARSNSARNRK